MPPAEAVLWRLEASTPPLRPDDEAPDEFTRLHRLVRAGVAAEVYADAAFAGILSSCVGGSFSLALLKDREIAGSGTSATGSSSQ